MYQSGTINQYNLIMLIITNALIRREPEGEMIAKRKEEACFPTTGMGVCKVESLVSVDERGQLVLPKEIRERTGIRGGDKLAVVTWEKGGEVCCLSLIRVEALTGMVKNLLGPLMGDVLGNRSGGQER